MTKNCMNGASRNPPSPHLDGASRNPPSPHLVPCDFLTYLTPKLDIQMEAICHRVKKIVSYA